MQKLLLKILFAIDVAAIVIHGILSQIVERYNTITGITTDGLGRVLVEPPLFLKVYLHIGEWAGLRWFIIDVVGFWTAVFIAYSLYQKITYEN